MFLDTCLSLNGTCPARLKMAVCRMVVHVLNADLMSGLSTWGFRLIRVVFSTIPTFY